MEGRGQRASRYLEGGFDRSSIGGMVARAVQPIVEGGEKREAKIGIAGRGQSERGL